MNRIFATNSNNYAALVARVALGITIFPHGAQKLFGWFGGNGFSGTISFFTNTVHLPWIIGFLVIIIESIGALCLMIGLATRLAAFATICSFIGVVFTSIIGNGFFMNWYKQPDKGEGLEYFILLFGLAIISLIGGGGTASVDSLITNSRHSEA